MIVPIDDSVCKNQHYFSLLKYVLAFFFLESTWVLAQEDTNAGSGASWGEVVFNEVMADPNPPVRYSEENTWKCTTVRGGWWTWTDGFCR